MQNIAARRVGDLSVIATSSRDNKNSMNTNEQKHKIWRGEDDVGAAGCVLYRLAVT